MNIQDEIDRLQTAARVANERAREWQAVADRQRGELEQVQRLNAKYEETLQAAVRRIERLEAERDQLKQLITDHLDQPQAVSHAELRASLGRAALRAGEGE